MLLQTYRLKSVNRKLFATFYATFFAKIKWNIVVEVFFICNLSSSNPVSNIFKVKVLMMSIQCSPDGGAFPCLRATRLISESFSEGALFASLLVITARKI